jgi:hypothetical protein
MTLAMPHNVAAVTSVKTENGSDTLKALSKVIVKGQIQTFEGERLSNFNGRMEAALYDKETNFVTIGRNNPPFSFKEWHNVLFRGQASVANGEFSLEFILPRNIAYTIDFGRLSLYASDDKNFSDAMGYSDSFKIGGSESDPVADNTAPILKAFIGDTTFINGGITSKDTWLITKFSDFSGINISDYGIGNGLVAVLDNDAEVYVLNSYYIAEVDNFTKGSLRYPLRGLTPGRHKITVKAWDTHNNPAQAIVEFVVTDDNALVIETFGNYPNPFTDNTTLFFTHNRSGDDLEAQLFIYSSQGNLHQALKIPVSESEYKIDLLQLSKGQKLPAGVYVSRLVVRSLTNGSKNEKVTKLIVLN